MRDLFTRWAHADAADLESRATRATWATGPKSSKDRSDLSGAADVAQRLEARATWATGTSDAGNRVARVAHASGARATTGKIQKPKQDKDVSGVLPLLPMLPTKPSEPQPCSLANCLVLIRETFEAVTTEYVDGALTLLDTDPGLCRRFHGTEAAIDAAVKTGPTEHELRAALAAHVAVIRECIERKRAQRETAADCPDMTKPELLR